MKTQNVTYQPYERVLFYAATLAIGVYLVWRLLYSLPFSYGYGAVALGLVVFLCEALSGVQSMINYLSCQTMTHPPERPDIPDSWFPDVDLFVATHDEDENLLYNTLNACRYLDYPDRSKIHVYVCDDGNRPAIKALADRLGVAYVGMPNPKHAKAGNLNNALVQTSSPIVAFLDADMIPRRDFVQELVPYFFLPKMKKNELGEWVERSPEEIDPKEKIGFVQSPQGFYTPDLFQYNLYAENRIPNEQAYFFREVNVLRSPSNASILCGSNVLMDRSALADIGYFATATITEDYETGMRMQIAGYKTLSLTKTLANGIAPPSVDTLIKQRERWGRGAIQTFRNMKPFTDSRVPLSQKIFHLNTLIFWLTFLGRYVFTMSPIIVAFFGVHVLECSFYELLIFWAPYYILHLTAMKRMSQQTRTINWCNVIDTVQYPFLCVPMIAEIFGISLKSFNVTQKGHRFATNTNPVLVLPHLLMLVLSIISLFLFISDLLHYRAYNVLIMIFWLGVNIKSLTLAVFFMLGRVNERNFFRFTVAAPVEFEIDGLVYKGATNDVSEGGLSAEMPFPVYIPPDRAITVRVDDRGYHAEMKCSMVQVKRGENKGWTYAMKLADIDEKNLSQYRQILYERDPTLPDTIRETIPIVEDLKVNFDKRLSKPPDFFSRKLPRILATMPAKLMNGTPVTVNDFSYRYVQIYPPLHLTRGETAMVEVEPGAILEVTLPAEHLAQQNNTLFYVVNWEHWTQDAQCRRIVARWAGAPEPTPAAPRSLGGDRVGMSDRAATGMTGRVLPAGI